MRQKDIEVQQLNVLISGEQLLRKEEREKLIQQRNEDLNKMNKMEQSFYQELLKQKDLFQKDLLIKDRLLNTEKSKHQEELKNIRERRINEVQHFSDSCAKFCYQMEQSLNGVPEIKEKPVNV